MCRARLLLLVVAATDLRADVPDDGNGEVLATSEDPLLNNLRSQLMADNYDYEQSESIEKALRQGGSPDVTQRTEDRVDAPDLKDMSDESELSDFETDRNVLNGYITDMSDINVRPVLRGDEDTLMRNGQEPGADPARLSESEPEPEKSISEPARQVAPLKLAKKPSQPNLAPVHRAQLDSEPADDMTQPEPAPEQLLARELSRGEQPRATTAPSTPPIVVAPMQWPQPRESGQLADGAPQRQIRVVSPFLVGEKTTEPVPFKVLTGHGQKQGRRSGAGVLSYVQMQLNDTVVVAPLGRGPLPDFQLPKGRRQYREISEDEEQEEDLTSSREKLMDSRRTM